MSAHALLSPSSAHRWMQCAGAPAMELGFPAATSQAAEDGAKKHKASEVLLAAGDESLVSLIDDRGLLRAPRAAGKKGLGDLVLYDGKPIECDASFVDQVDGYAACVREYTQSRVWFAEQTLSISHLTGEKGATGTADVVVLGLEANELVIIDAKFGRMPVAAEGNPQLLIYWLAAAERYGMLGSFTRGRVGIYQPVVSREPVEWQFDAADISTFSEKVTRRAGEALRYIEAARTGAAVPLSALKPSESACRWCRARHICPAYEAFVHAVVLPQEAYTDATGKAKYARFVISWAEAVLGDVERRVLSGEPIDGFKVVQGREGNRKWRDVNAAEQYMKNTLRWKDGDMYTNKLISPTQALARVKESETRSRRLGLLIERTPANLYVVPVEDPRPAASVPGEEPRGNASSAADDFDVLTEDAK